MKSTMLSLALLALMFLQATCQRTLSANAEHSAIPPPYANPYSVPHRYVSWLQQHDATWTNPLSRNSASSNATDSDGNVETTYSPSHAPALPLAVRSPYTSAWAPVANNGALNSQWPIFWDGSALGWEGIVVVDGLSYEWMGVGSRSLPLLSNLIPATPLAASYDSSYTNFTFAAGPMELTASFFSPVTPADLCRTSIPLSYLSVSVVSKDEASHNVSLYTDVNGAWVTQPAAPLTWSISESVNSDTTSAVDSLYSWVVSLQDAYLFGEQNGQDGQRAGQGVFPQWGNFTWSSSQGPAKSLRFKSGFSANQRYQYVTGQALDNSVDQAFRSYVDQEPVFAFEHTLGEVGPNVTAPVVFSIGHVVTPAIRFLSPVGIESLEPWWASTSCLGTNDIYKLIRSHYLDLPQAQAGAAQFEAKLRGDIATYYGSGAGGVNSSGQQAPPAGVSNGTGDVPVSGPEQFGQQYTFNSDTAYGYLTPSTDNCNSTLNGIAIPNTSEQDSYYAITALAARQVPAAYILTVPSAATASNSTEPLAFQKEISSNGNMNTVDVIFPAMPFFLWFNPDFLRYVLEPLFINQESNFYPNDYSMHDLGARFPNASGHVEGNDEYMPVEESGNMIIMSYAIYHLSPGKLSYLQDHYPILQRWAKYLIDYSLVPAIQLSTDDFAGQLANQTNLAIKGIVGLAAMSEISRAVGDEALAQTYSTIAQDYYNQWTELAIDPSGTHTLLAYQWRSSWGLLYNTYPAKLLNLSVIPDALFKQQSDFYPSVSQIWGVPLDNRHYWTKSDWEMWAAATCEAPTRRLFVDALAYWLNTTSSNRPFTDLYETVHRGESPNSPWVIEFFARPVQGGLYSLLALVAAGVVS